MVRNGLGIVSTVLFLSVICHAPLADAVAANFVAPFFVTIYVAIGELLIVKFLDDSQALVVAPFHYTDILGGTLYGFHILVIGR